jgi:AbrB family looped-hinge helix DNA binding protein
MAAVIPKALRESLKLKKGDKLEVRGNKIIRNRRKRELLNGTRHY